MRDYDPAIRIEAYIAEIRRALMDVSALEREDFLQELRSHIIERAESNIDPSEDQLDAILSSVGNPKQLASQYKASILFSRAAHSMSPLILLGTTFRWATTGVAGILTFLIAVFGYGITLVCLLCSILKPFFPARIGLWLTPQQTVTLGYWNGRFVGTEVYGFAFRPPFNIVLGTLTSTNGYVRETLGNWIYPATILGAILLFLSTTYFTRWLIRNFAWRRNRNSFLTDIREMRSIPIEER